MGKHSLRWRSGRGCDARESCDFAAILAVYQEDVSRKGHPPPAKDRHGQQRRNRRAASIPSANVATRASMAWPSASRRLHSSHRLASLTWKTSMNSPSSGCGSGCWFSGSVMSTSTCTMRKLVLQNPGSCALASCQPKGV